MRNGEGVELVGQDEDWADLERLVVNNAEFEELLSLP